MIPAHPRSKPLELEDRREIEWFIRRFGPFSDYCFTSLWCWNTAGTCRLSTVNGNLAVRFPDYLTGDGHYGFLGNIDVLSTVRALLSTARNDGTEPRLRLVPNLAITAGQRLRRAFAVVDDPHNFDYVCSVRDWVDLPGKRFARHRARINRCQRLHALDARPLALGDGLTRDAILHLFDRWADGREPEAPEPHRERKALERLFVPEVAHGLQALGLFERDAMRAFSIWERAPDPRFSVHHFMKTDRSCPGASSVMVQARARILHQDGCLFANIEQDLGLPGLIAYKQSLRPCGYLRKVVIAEHDAPRASGAEAGL